MIGSRTRTGMLVAVLLAVATVLTACGQRTVRVETGTRVVCTYGETVSSSVKSIDVPAEKAAAYGVVTKVVTCGRHRELERLYAAAQTAISKGDLASASSKLAEVVALDPRFRRASSQLDAIKAGRTPSPDTSSAPSAPATGTSRPSVPPVAPTGNLGAWVPSTLTGYTARQPIVDAYSLSREYVPAEGSSGGYLVIAVEQFKDAKSAKSALGFDVARLYSEDVSTSTIAGRQVRFGSDGRQFATAAWNEGGVLIVVEEDAAGRSASAVDAHLADIVAQVLE